MVFRMALEVISLLFSLPFVHSDGHNHVSEALSSSTLATRPAQHRVDLTQLSLKCIVPPGFRRISESSRYILSEEEFKLSESRAACTSVGLKHGAILNDEDNDEVAEYLEIGNFVRKERGVWIDAVRSSLVSGFQTYDGCPLQFSRFLEGEPSVGMEVSGKTGDAFCGVYVFLSAGNLKWTHFERNGRKTAHWATYPCDGDTRVRHALCECPHQVSCTDLGQGSNEVGSGEELHRLTHSEFFYSNFYRNWSVAMRSCVSFGMKPANINDANELDILRRALARSEVAYLFLWLGARVEGGHFFWLEPTLTPNLKMELNSTAKGLTNSCLGISTGSRDLLYTQSTDCSLPLRFLCKRPTGFSVPFQCRNKDAFEKLSDELWTLKNVKFTYETAMMCCKVQNLSLTVLSDVVNKIDEVKEYLQNGEALWATQNEGACTTYKFTSKLLIEVPRDCSTLTRRFLCSDLGGKNSTDPAPASGTTKVTNLTRYSPSRLIIRKTKDVLRIYNTTSMTMHHHHVNPPSTRMPELSLPLGQDEILTLLKGGTVLFTLLLIPVVGIAGGLFLFFFFDEGFDGFET